jgi:NADH-quinone oxidoreductase subunit E
MTRLLKKISSNDPLSQPDKKVIIDNIIDENKKLPGSVMLVLNELQGQIGFVTPAMQAYVAKQLKVPYGAVTGVVGFYSFFNTKPRGQNTIKFCLGTACYVGGMPQLIEKAKHILGIEVGDTTPCGSITIEVCRCIGACSKAPVLMCNEEQVGPVKPDKMHNILKKYWTRQQETAAN